MLTAERDVFEVFSFPLQLLEVDGRQRTGSKSTVVLIRVASCGPF